MGWPRGENNGFLTGVPLLPSPSRVVLRPNSLPLPFRTPASQANVLLVRNSTLLQPSRSCLTCQHSDFNSAQWFSDNLHVSCSWYLWSRGPFLYSKIICGHQFNKSRSFHKKQKWPLVGVRKQLLILWPSIEHTPQVPSPTNRKTDVWQETPRTSVW